MFSSVSTLSISGHDDAGIIVLIGIFVSFVGLLACLAYRFTRRRSLRRLRSQFDAAIARSTALTEAIEQLRGEPLLSLDAPLTGASADQAEAVRKINLLAEFQQMEVVRQTAAAQLVAVDGQWLISGKEARKAIAQLEQVTAHLQPQVQAVVSMAKTLTDAATERSRLEANLLRLVEEQERKLAELSLEGLQFAPGINSLQCLKADHAAIAARTELDPVGLNPQLQALLAQAEGALTKLGEFLRRRDSLHCGAGSVIERLAERIQAVRSEPFVFRLPLLPGQEAIPVVQERQLSGESDRDAELERARGQLVMAREALCGGDYSAAERFGQAAKHIAEEALASIDSYVSAREEVERELLPTFSRVEALRLRLEAGEQSHASLVREFPNERSDSPQRIWAAMRERVVNATGSLYGLNSVYAHQCFVNARETIRRLQERLLRMETNLPDVDAALESLRRARQVVNQGRARLDRACSLLASRLSDNKVALPVQEVVAIEAALQHASVLKLSDENWLAGATAVDTAMTALSAAEVQVDRWAKAFQSAKDRVNQALHELSWAQAYVKDDTSSQSVLQWLKEAETICADLSESLKTPGSDWAAVETQAALVSSLVDKSEKKARVDKKEFDQAMAAFNAAELKQKKLGKLATGPNASAKMKAASAVMDEARQAIAQREWRKVLQCALKASSSFQASLNARGMSAG